MLLNFPDTRLIATNRSPSYTALGKIFSEPQHFAKANAEDNGRAITAIDFEEQSAGYQAAFSRLAASENPEPDPVAYVQNPLQYLQQELDKLKGRIGPRADAMISAAGGRIA